MWPFAIRQTMKNSGLLIGSADYHSHILPAVDDGVQTMDEALEILACLEQHGVARLWLTPHVMEDIPNTTERLKLHFARLMAEYRGSIKLNLAAEYMLDNLFDARLADNDLLPIGEQGDHILVETSFFNPSMRLYDTLARIKSKGFHPLLAHPERYMYMGEKDYKTLKAAGVKFQLNWASLAGRYGSSVQKRAKWLVENNMYAVAGSDTHSVALRHWEMKIDATVVKKIKASCMLVRCRERNL